LVLTISPKLLQPSAPLILSLLLCSHLGHASETDQFTTPRAALKDVGPELSRKVVEIIESDRSGEDPERILSRWDDRNIFISRLVRWMNKLPAGDPPVTFRPHVFDSIFRLALSPFPASFFFDAPTVNVHGYYLGRDNIDHFFQQGHEYFELASNKAASGASYADAIAAAVAYGVMLEHSYFGTAMSGVYSNGDLAANYAGMKFYSNLQNPL